MIAVVEQPLISLRDTPTFTYCIKLLLAPNVASAHDGGSSPIVSNIRIRASALLLALDMRAHILILFMNETSYDTIPIPGLDHDYLDT